MVDNSAGSMISSATGVVLLFGKFSRMDLDSAGATSPVFQMMCSLFNPA